MTDDKFTQIICKAMKVFAWMLLLFGIGLSIISSAVLAPLFMLSRWSGVAVLVLFILIFLAIHLITKIAEMAMKIKIKVGA